MEKVKWPCYWNKELMKSLRRKWEERGHWPQWMWFSSCLFPPSNPAANVLMNSLLNDTCSTVVHHKSEGNDQWTWNYEICYRRKVGRALEFRLDRLCFPLQDLLRYVRTLHSNEPGVPTLSSSGKSQMTGAVKQSIFIMRVSLCFSSWGDMPDLY